GLYHQDEGEIYLDGQPVEIRDANDAIAHRIGMVHQHFMLVKPLTVAENIILGQEIRRFGAFLNLHEAERRIRALSDQYQLEVDPTAKIQDLPVGTQQRVEIIKALYREADILILDEPTAVLTPQETERLFLTVFSLAQQGKSIIFITHKLKEVFEVATRITVLRDGRVVGTTNPKDTNERQLAAMMVGRQVILKVEKEPAQPKEAVLQVQDLAVEDDRHNLTVNGVSFQVRAGEVLGVAGVQGNGQTELTEAITGLRRAKGGAVSILGHNVTNASPRRVTEAGSAHIPEDRHKHGLVLSYSVANNLVLCTYYKPPFAKGVVIQEPVIAENAERLVKQFDIRTPSVFVPASNLSGGNQQKTIVAREFSRPIELLIAAQPTRGLDVGSIEYIHQQIIKKRDDGCAVLLVSAELDEIMALSYRIAVMYRGQIMDTIPIEEATKENLGLLMAGVRDVDEFKEAVLTAD
ncbi:MAG: ABC transporter ATP-binding protein, partial [Chloroflexi bacterium]|nr:ABC transporter ATP-binding protein [Chloroflexota bacterium]